MRVGRLGSACVQTPAVQGGVLLDAPPPRPASVMTVPPMVTSRIVSLPASVTYTFPAPSTAKPRGALRPEATTVTTVPLVATHFLRLLAELSAK